MEDSLTEILEGRLKKILPFLCSVLLVLVAYVPIHLPLSQYLRPDVGMICVYFWALYRQDLFGALSAFVLGFVADSLSAVPIGLNVFSFMLVFALSSTFGSYVNSKPFALSWGGFAIISLLAFVAKWLLISVYYSKFLAFGGVFTAYLATVFLYPLIARLNIWIQNRFLANEEVIYEQG